MAMLVKGRLTTGLMLAAVLPGSLAAAQPATRTERVQFAKGTSSKVLKGTIQGDSSVDYVVGAAAGQTMTVSMTTSNKAAYFNIMQPGEENTAFFIGSTSGDKYEGTLPADGNYKIRVYLMRSAARRRERAGYSLSISIGGKPKEVRR